MAQKSYKLHIRHEDEMFWATVEDLPGCFASGRDMDELMEAAAESIGIYLMDASDVLRDHSSSVLAYEEDSDEATPAGGAPVADLLAARRGRSRPHEQYQVPSAEILIEA